jgi:hypothetical protein
MMVDNQRGNNGRFAKGNSLGFQPGRSGNPKGRPKSITLSEAYRKQLAQPVPGNEDGLTYADVIASVVCEAAAKGDVQAARELADRTEGKARQTIDHGLTPETRRRVVVEQMFLKLTAQGISETEAKASLVALGVSEYDLADIQSS